VTTDLPNPFDQLREAVIVLDQTRHITAVNQAATRLTGYAPSELLGRSCVAVLDPRDATGRPIWTDGWPAGAALRSVTALAGQSVSLRRRSGPRASVVVTGTYQRGPDGTVAGAVLCLRDLARGSHPAVTGIEIVSTLSHELRAPLSSVKGYTSLLINRWDRLGDDEKRLMLEQVNHDADRVTRLITELLDISRLESGRLVLRRQLVDLPTLAANVVAKVALQYDALNAETTFPADFPKVYADPDKLEQVLTNLIENACKYGSPEGVRVDGARGPGTVSVAVTDRGDGIPPADLRKVFGKFFYRAASRPTGSGLGLWISRGLVESHGGVLVAESNPGTGATFRFTLPLIDLDELQES
jgi:signal transduction histidine kinase